jgi:eukaryotic-like serine/threonine-protein kinase
MERQRWREIQTIFHAAADLPESDRRRFVETACAGDEELHSEVLAMLEQDGNRKSLLDHSLAEIANKAISSPDPLPFKEFGPYRILRLLGEGGMGVVYLAERKDLANQVAIKILRDAWLSPARSELFISEQRTLARLNHPSIARLYDAATLEDGTPYFVMEYVEGVPLTSYCRDLNCTLKQRLQLLRAVCEAVQHAHSHAVIHRDLKPSNILVKRDGSVRLLDFGIAKQLETLDLPAVDQTMTALRLLTPAYAAPEQILGEPAGAQGDVYSLGVILYQLLTGELPFDLSNMAPAEALAAVTGGEASKPSSVVRRTSQQAEGPQISLSAATWADLDLLCMTAMHKDRQRRYSSAEAFMRDLDHHLNGEPLEAHADSVGYRIGKFIRRNRSAVSAATATLVTIVGLITFFTVRLTRERDYANRQTAIATAINQFLSDDLLGRGNPFQSGKAAETLLDAINEASPSIDRKFAEEPQIAARLHLTIAQALDSRSNFPEARNEYDRAHSLFLQTGGTLSSDAIMVQLQRASMEARSFQSGGIPAAKSLVAEQESLLKKIRQPRSDLAVWLFTAKGMIALVESDAKLANQCFRNASDAAVRLREFDEIAKFNLRQRLAFTYIRLGDGATAERLARELISGYSAGTGPNSPYVLRVRLNLAQAFMIERKFAESVQEANAIYPDFLAKFGPDHQLTMQLLSTRAQSEGSLGDFDDSVRDDLTIYQISAKKQGPLAFYTIATLSDASLAQCRANHSVEGERNGRKAYDSAATAFGARSGLAGGTALTLADCLIGLGRLDEASKYLANIDVKAVSQLTGDPDVGAGITLAQAEIAAKKRDYARAKQFLDSVRAVFSRPDTETYQKRKVEEISAMIGSRG